MLGVRSERVGIFDAIPNVPIHSSVLISLIAGLFLAALMFRAHRLFTQPQQRPRLTARQARIARRRARRHIARYAARTERRAQMTSTERGTTPAGTPLSTETAADSVPASSRGSTDDASGNSVSSRKFHIHWGRTLLSLTAVLALLVGAVSAVLAWQTALLGISVPLVCAGIFAASLVILQVMAITRRRRKRRQRVEAAMQEAMNPPEAILDVRGLDGGSYKVGGDHLRGEDNARAAVPEETQYATCGGKSPIQDDPAHLVRPFDALRSDGRGAGGPDSLVNLDEDGLPDNPERLFSAEDADDHRVKVFDQSTLATTAQAWQPREIPEPKYLVAEKMDRPEPEPIATPEEPRPSSDIRLRQPAAPAAIAPVIVEPVTDDFVDHAETTPQSMDLDEVLKRRRA